MTARTYTAAEMRGAYFLGVTVPRTMPSSEIDAEALRRWPDPAPEPPAMTVRVEPDPDDDTMYWRWTSRMGLQLKTHDTGPWIVPPDAWFEGHAAAPARLALWADLAAYPMRLPDGRPCTLKGVARVDEQKVLAAVRRLHRGNCHGTFNGGWESPEGRRAFHHGMDTVFNLLDEALTGEAKP